MSGSRTLSKKANRPHWHERFVPWSLNKRPNLTEDASQHQGGTFTSTFGNSLSSASEQRVKPTFCWVCPVVTSGYTVLLSVTVFTVPSACCTCRVVVTFSPPSGNFSRTTCGPFIVAIFASSASAFFGSGSAGFFSAGFAASASGFFTSGSGFFLVSASSSELSDEELSELLSSVRVETDPTPLLLAREVTLGASVFFGASLMESGEPRSWAKISVTPSLGPPRSFASSVGSFLLDCSVVAELSEVVDSLIDEVLVLVFELANGSKSSKSPAGLEFACKTNNFAVNLWGKHVFYSGNSVSLAIETLLQPSIAMVTETMSHLKPKANLELIFWEITAAMSKELPHTRKQSAAFSNIQQKDWNFCFLFPHNKEQTPSSPGIGPKTLVSIFGWKQKDEYISRGYSVTLVSRESKSKGSLGLGGGLPSRGELSPRSTRESDMTVGGPLGSSAEVDGRRRPGVEGLADDGGGGSVGKVDGSCWVRWSRIRRRKLTSTLNEWHE